MDSRESLLTWHALLAPLPASARVCRRPVAPPEILARPEGAAVAGWEQLTVELSAGVEGLRHLMVILDAEGVPISFGDTVVYSASAWNRKNGCADAGDGEGREVSYHESIGGRIESDGSFRGTRWETTIVCEEAGDGDPRIDAVRSEPDGADIQRIKGLVDAVLALA